MSNASFDVSDAAAWTVLVLVCVFFTVLAFGSMDYFRCCLPRFCANLCLLNKSGDETKTVDYFLAARNSAGWLSIGLSFFASGMGAWVVYGSTEMGANPLLSWMGVLGYSAASAFPAIAVCLLGPMIREKSNETRPTTRTSVMYSSSTVTAFSVSDFGRERYGRLMQVSISTISVFYMFVYIVAELTSISNVYALLTNNLGNKAFGIGVTVVIGVFTLLYTGFAGLPSSIVTDRFQGYIMAFLVVVLTVAVCVYDENQVTRDEFKLASNWTVEGFMAMVTLFIAILSAEMFNQATWQRVYAAESVPALRKGFALGSVLVFLLMMFFGIMGMIAYANDPESYDAGEKFSFLAFFDLLLPLGPGWHIVVLIFVTALAASSIDSLQNGLNSVFYRDVLRAGCNPHLSAYILIALVNIPAIWLASRKFEVLGLFLVADLVCATAVLPTFLGLQERDLFFGLLPAPTEPGAFLGIISGIATVLINGRINGAHGFDYFWLDNGAICALCGSATMISFIVTPIVAGIMTYVFTHLDICIRGKEGARLPLFVLPFDKDTNINSGARENGEVQEMAAVDIEADKNAKNERPSELETKELSGESPSEQDAKGEEAAVAKEVDEDVMEA